MNEYKIYCVLCGQEAITTVGHIPVCAEHDRQYQEEGRQYLPYSERAVWQRIQQAYYDQQHALKHSQEVDDDDQL